MKLSNWIRCDNQQPTIKGWYDVAYCDADKETMIKRFYFDGRKWRHKNKGRETAFGNIHIDQGDSWRGLANPPKQSKGEK